MAKKTAYETYRDQIPLVREVQLPMVADSTVETAIEIDTDIAGGAKKGWIIYGMRYMFQDITSPHLRKGFGGADACMTVQLCRGEVPATPVFLSRSDNDLILEDIVDVTVNTAVGFETRFMPRTVVKAAVTQLPALYLLFGSDVDVVEVSAATIELFAEILYHVVDAPEALAERL